MHRGSSIALFVLLLTLAGCSQSPSNNSTGTSGGTSDASPLAENSADEASDPAAQAAYDFLDAVLKGDTQRASNRLTPMAVERIIETGKQFAPPGLATASCQIGEVRRPSDSQALVQCFLSDVSEDGQSRTEEIGCLLRLVDGSWRVSGIAYRPGPNRPPMILDFENPQRGPVSPQQQLVEGTNGQDEPVASRPRESVADPATESRY